MIKIIKLEEKKSINVSLKDERRNINRVKNLWFGKFMEEVRDKVMMVMIGRFGRLGYEDIEEIYSDGCLVMWNKMMENVMDLENKNMTGYLVRICRNVGMHYLRKVKDDMVSLDELMERKGDSVDIEDGLMKMFDILDEKIEEKDMVYKKLDMIWESLNDVEKMILECYYWEGCKMEEISKRIGYKNSDSVKSKKRKILKKMMDMIKTEEGGNNLSPSFLSIIIDRIFRHSPLYT